MECPNCVSLTELNFICDSLLNQIESAIFLLHGKIHEAMDNRGPAVDCFKQALISDVYCYEAFENLIQHHMMTASEGSLKHLIL